MYFLSLSSPQEDVLLRCKHMRLFLLTNKSVNEEKCKLDKVIPECSQGAAHLSGPEFTHQYCSSLLRKRIRATVGKKSEF